MKFLWLSLLLPWVGAVKTDLIHKLPRIYCPQLRLQSSTVVELGAPKSPIAHYISNVLRMKTGHMIRIFNGIEGEYVCRLMTVKKGDAVFAEVLEKTKDVQEETNLNCTLYFSPIKSKRMKLLVEKCTEIGVSALQPVITQNTNEVLTPIDLQSLEATIIEAAEQSQRLSIPALREPVSFASFLERASSVGGESAVTLACLERSSSTPLLTALNEVHNTSPRPHLGILIGPEGGFPLKEISDIEESAGSSLRLVSLGTNVLRSETAALFALSCWSAVHGSR